MESSAGRRLALFLGLLMTSAATSTHGGEPDPPAEPTGTSGAVGTPVPVDGVQSKLTTGRWKTVAFQSGAATVQGAAAAAAMPSEIEFGDGTVAIFHQGQQIGAATYAIDETASPARMTFETTAPRESLPKRYRTVGFCVNGVCYSMSIEETPKESLPEPTVKTTVAFRVDGDLLEMHGVPDVAVGSDESAPPETTPTLRIVYERIKPNDSRISNSKATDDD